MVARKEGIKYNIYEEKFVSKKDKLIEKLKNRPKDFSYAELQSLLKYFGYEDDNKGRTSGSRVMFVSEEYAPILLHKPHGRNYLLDYQIKQIVNVLEQEGLF